MKEIQYSYMTDGATIYVRGKSIAHCARIINERTDIRVTPHLLRHHCHGHWFGMERPKHEGAGLWVRYPGVTPGREALEIWKDEQAKHTQPVSL